MPMPETAMNENYLFKPGEYKVWGARHISTMQSETIPKGVRQTSDNQFRFRIFALNAGHQGRLFAGGDNVHTFLPSFG
jgi:hypothetical protein